MDENQVFAFWVMVHGCLMSLVILTGLGLRMTWNRVVQMQAEFARQRNDEAEAQRRAMAQVGDVIRALTVLGVEQAKRGNPIVAEQVAIQVLALREFLRHVAGGDVVMPVSPPAGEETTQPATPGTP